MNERFIYVRDIFEDDEIEDALAMCEIGEHEFEPTMILLDGIIPTMSEECIHCGAINWED